MSTSAPPEPGAQAGSPWLAAARASDHPGRHRRMPVVFAWLVLVDAAFIALYAVLGQVPLLLVPVYAGVGLVLALGPRRLAPRLDGATRASLQTTGACTLMLATAAAAPALAVPMLSGALGVLSAGALQMRRRAAVAAAAFVGVLVLVVVARPGASLAMPLDSLPLRLVGAAWLVWIFARAAALHRVGRGLQRQIDAGHEALAEARAQHEDLAARDELTGLANRRLALQLLASEHARRQRGGPPYAVARLDIDQFAALVGHHGRSVGDEVLRQVARLTLRQLRAGDHLARVGGEAFLLLFAGIGSEDAAAAAERVRLAVQAHDWGVYAPGLAPSVSIGLAAPRATETPDEALARADAALHEARGGGANRVVSANG